MFHKPIGQIVVAIIALGLSAQPTISHATVPVPPASAEAAAPPNAGSQGLDGFSFEAFRRNSKAKLSSTQGWVNDQTRQRDFSEPFQTLERKIDRLQDQVKPAGRSLKRAAKQHMPGKRLIQQGDRTFSVYGLLLMLAFGTVFLVMSLSSPASRLGGRH